MPTRKHIRLRDFDYSSGNAYFITVCVKGFDYRFGEIRNGIMGLSDIGNIAACYLQNIPLFRTDAVLDEFIIMPDHLHCIIELKHRAFSSENFNRYGKPVADSVSMIINQYKGAVKKWCNRNGFCDFEWQGKFYDHVIRDNKEYWAIKNYIINNPSKWDRDRSRSDLPSANPPSANPSLANLPLTNPLLTNPDG
jgi:putative transposase